LIKALYLHRPKTPYPTGQEGRKAKEEEGGKRRKRTAGKVVGFSNGQGISTTYYSEIDGLI
jgi:hypothetical protein